LTHLDTVPKAAANSWKKAYETLGAERWDDAPLNTQVANQARQAQDLRNQYNIADAPVTTKPKKNKSYFESQNKKQLSAITPVEEVLFVNAKQGQGIHALHRAIFKAGAHVQERRERRGLNPRALRVGIIGYPNVGKSALINKILGRKRARTANTPGVTRSLQWIRVRTDESKANSSGSSPSSTSTKKEFELLDSPGIIPAKMVDQSDALLLAACNCIGQAAYDNQAVAAYLCEWLKAIHIMGKEHLSAPEWRKKCKERYGFDPLEKIEVLQTDIEADPIYDYMTGEDMLFKVADNTCQGDPEDASRKIIQDFRAGRMGPISLQLAPETEQDNGQLQVPLGDTTILGPRSKRTAQEEELERKLQVERARMALETAKERGLELPPIVEDPKSSQEASDVGKGLFDGW
jgi:ribosome biogenesis GTPase A